MDVQTHQIVLQLHIRAYSIFQQDVYILYICTVCSRIAMVVKIHYKTNNNSKCR
jgi:hypothetical protein